VIEGGLVLREMKPLLSIPLKGNDLLKRICMEIDLGRTLGSLRVRLSKLIILKQRELFCRVGLKEK